MRSSGKGLPGKKKKKEEKRKRKKERKITLAELE